MSRNNERGRLAAATSSATLTREDLRLILPYIEALFGEEGMFSLPTAGTGLDDSRPGSAIDDERYAELDEANRWGAQVPPAGVPEILIPDPAPDSAQPRTYAAFTADRGAPSEVGPATHTTNEMAQLPFYNAHYEPHTDFNANNPLPHHDPFPAAAFYAAHRPPSPGLEAAADDSGEGDSFEQQFDDSFDEGIRRRLCGFDAIEDKATPEVLNECIDPEILHEARLTSSTVLEAGADDPEAEDLEVDGLVTEGPEADDLEAEDLEADDLGADNLEAEDLVAEDLVTEDLVAEDLEAEGLEADASFSQAFHESTAFTDDSSNGAAGPAQGDHWSDSTSETQSSSESSRPSSQRSAYSSDEANDDSFLASPKMPQVKPPCPVDIYDPDPLDPEPGSSSEDEDEDGPANTSIDPEEDSQPPSPVLEGIPDDINDIDFDVPDAVSTPLQSPRRADETPLPSSPLKGDDAGTEERGIEDEDSAESQEPAAADPPSRSHDNVIATDLLSNLIPTEISSSVESVAASQGTAAPTRSRRRKRPRDDEENSSSFLEDLETKSPYPSPPHSRKRRRTDSQPFGNSQEESEEKHIPLWI